MNERPDEPGLRWMGRDIIIFFLRFLAASAVLYALYLWIGTWYARLIGYGAKPLLAIGGYDIIMEMVMKITEEISLNPVVFLSFVIAVPRLPWRRRFVPAALGAAILTAANILVVTLAFVSYYHGNNERLWTGSEFLILTINFFLPIALWFILLPVRSFLPIFRGESSK